ncbi:sigma 54-interacting transcriptional regulator [Neobacillus citreus]|uniref:Sigma 54-interacting transcriptional regulator n=1 Tax=Neobacillus citreus TaxID=2833578 RepID=A0A942YCI7_9BACI|nr:sigma 54-interacting transcriptional regulator [Neobacillus citreus]MCH6264339.1 sigma 54-interacting transcriptional regulator [Neobacillus citreus]
MKHSLFNLFQNIQNYVIIQSIIIRMGIVGIMLPKIVVLGYTVFSDLAKSVMRSMYIPPWVEYEIREIPSQLLAVDSVKHLQSDFEPATIVISGDRSALALKKTLKNLVIPVKVTGYDILKSIRELGSNDVVVVNYQENMKELSQVTNLLNVRITQFTFRNQEEGYSILEEIQNNGYRHVIGGSWICAMAPKYGLKGVSYYSYLSMSAAFEDALNILNAYRNELEQAVLFKTIVDMNRNGIISTDKNLRVNVMSMAADKILGMKRTQMIGKTLHEVIPTLDIEEGEAQYNTIFEHKQKKLVADIAPVILNGEKMGYIFAIDDVDHVQETERRIRKKITQKQLAANYSFEDIIGISPLIQETIKKAKKFSKSSSSILIHGESGTGKELFAQSIHNESNRSMYPFVAVNCAALPESLLDSELFGYEEGAFTGAKKGGKPGLFELAHQGTIFLDEISELPLHLQSRLLRVLQEKEIMRIGGDQVIPIDIRIIAASNKNLMDEVKKGNFREDLYFRINVLQLFIPPLRRRKEDISLLFKYFIKNEVLLSENITLDQLYCLHHHSWPGNVREIENVAERFTVLIKGEKVSRNTIQSLLQQALYPENENVNDENEVSESQLVQQTLDKFNGNRDLAAKFLGMSRTTLWRKMKNLEL